MGREVSLDRKDVAPELDGDRALLCVSGRDPATCIYDQYRGVAQHDATESHQDSRIVSGRRGRVEVAVLGAEERGQAMECDPRLACGAEPLYAALGGSDRTGAGPAGALAGVAAGCGVRGPAGADDIALFRLRPKRAA